MCAAQLTYYVLLFLMISYSRGIGGVLGYIFGEDSIFNIPNSYIGLVFFSVLLVLSELTVSQVLSDTCTCTCSKCTAASHSLRLPQMLPVHEACTMYIVVHKLSLDLVFVA